MEYTYSHYYIQRVTTDVILQLQVCLLHHSLLVKVSKLTGDGHNDQQKDDDEDSEDVV